MARPKTIQDGAILSAAREVFIAAGALGSTREIARRLGVSEATVFKRFPTKVGLFLAAMAPPIPDTVLLLAKARAEQDTRKALHVIGRLTLGYFRTSIPAMLPLITHPGIGIDELLRRFGESPASTLNDAITAYLAEQRDSGAIDTPQPRAAAGLIVAAMHSVALFELMGLHGGALPTAAVRAMIDALWHGIAPKSAPAPRRKPAAKRASRPRS